jgi:RNA polymerase sigma-70 factor (ECF subfamily)
MLSQQLIAAAARSDRKSQEEIFRLCQPLVKTWCVRYLTNGEDAEECLMNCFFKFFSSLKSFSYQSEKETLAFIKKIAINECLMKLRKSALFPLERIIVEQDQETNDDIFNQLEAAEIFKQILKLPIGYRTVFNLYEIEGFSHKEISKMLSISIGTSKSQLSKAKRMLQEKINFNNSYNATISKLS